MTELVELGRATTHGQALPLGTDDPVIAARAVRRALAAAGRRALDVSDVVVAANEPIAPEHLAAFTRRALGPHGDLVRARSSLSDDREPSGLAGVAVDAARRAPGAGLVIAIGLSPDGTTEARCLGVGAAGRPGTAGATG